MPFGSERSLRPWAAWSSPSIGHVAAAPGSSRDWAGFLGISWIYWIIRLANQKLTPESMVFSAGNEEDQQDAG